MSTKESIELLYSLAVRSDMHKGISVEEAVEFINRINEAK